MIEVLFSSISGLSSCYSSLCPLVISIKEKQLALTVFPLRFPALMIGSPPRVAPHLALRNALVRQESRIRSLQHVRVTADRMRRVAVVRTLAVEADVVARGHEESLEELSVNQRVDLGGDVAETARHGHGASEPE